MFGYGLLLAHVTDDYRVEPESVEDFNNMGGADITMPGKKCSVQNCSSAR